MDDVMTTDQIGRLVRDGAAEVERVGAALTAANAVYAGGTDRYFYSTDEGHAASFAEQLPALERAEEAAIQATAAADRNARAVLKQLTGVARAAAQSGAGLTPAERADAAARLPFVEQDAARARPADLAAQLRLALTTGDRAGLFVLSRAVRARLEEDRPGDRSDPAAASELRALAGEAGDRLRGADLDPLERQATALLVRASEVGGAARRRRRQADTERRMAEDGLVPIPR